MTLPIDPIDHIADGTAKVISQYRDKPRFLLKLACYLQGIQWVEDQFATIHDAFRPATATGFRLDWVGAKVGQTRIGSTDEVYRRHILARIAANHSRGQTQDLLKVASALWATYRYDEIPQFAWVQIATAESAEIRQAEWSMLQAAAPVGVGIILVHSGAPSGSFEFTWSTEIQDIAFTHGFDTVAGSINAGYFATVLEPS